MVQELLSQLRLVLRIVALGLEFRLNLEAGVCGLEDLLLCHHLKLRLLGLQLVLSLHLVLLLILNELLLSELLLHAGLLLHLHKSSLAVVDCLLHLLRLVDCHRPMTRRSRSLRQVCERTEGLAVRMVMLLARV